MLAEEKGSVIVIDDVGGKFEDEIARHSLSKKFKRFSASGAEPGPQNCRQEGSRLHTQKVPCGSLRV